MNNYNKPVRKRPSFFGSILPALLLLAVLALYGLNRYTDLKPLDRLSEYLGLRDLIQTGSAETVSGRYECHYSEKDLGNGVMRTEQTWAYVFFSDGTFTTYLNNEQQFSGTWSQSGKTLTINTPAIAGVTEARTNQVTVSSDGKSFKVDEESTYVWVGSK